MTRWVFIPQCVPLSNIPRLPWRQLIRSQLMEGERSKLASNVILVQRGAKFIRRKPTRDRNSRSTTKIVID